MALFATAIITIFETDQIALLAIQYALFVMEPHLVIACCRNHPQTMFVTMDTFITQKFVMVVHSVIVLFVIQLVLIAMVLILTTVLLVVKMQHFNQIKLAHVAKGDQELLLHAIETLLQLLCL